MTESEPKGKAEIPVVTRECRRNSRETTQNDAWAHNSGVRDGFVQRAKSNPLVVTPYTPHPAALGNYYFTFCFYESAFSGPSPPALNLSQHQGLFK